MNAKKYFILLLSACLLIFSVISCKPADKDNSSSETFTSGNSAADSIIEIESESDSGSVIVDSEGNVISTPNNKNSSTGRSNTSAGTGSKVSTAPNDTGATYFNVRNYGAKGNGQSDDSGAIQKAINAAVSAGGGIVYMPAGLYLMNSGLDVPMGISLRGTSPSTTKKWRKVSDLGTGTLSFESAGSSWLDASNFKGTWILVNHGAGNVDSHATFELQGNASIYNLGFVHKNTAPVVSKITVYPPAIAIKNVKDNPYTRDGMTIENIMLLNAYIGIGVHAGNGKILDHQNGQQADLYSMGRLRVHQVTGGCVFRGIIMKGLLDTIDLQDISFGYTNLEKTYSEKRANECADFEWYRADGSNATNIFSFGARYGILTSPAFTSGSSSMRLSKANLTGQYPIYLTATGQYEIEDCTFTTINFNKLCKENKFQAMTVKQDTTSVHQPFYVFNRLKIVNKIQSSSANDTSLHITTTHGSASAMVMFSNITFTGWSPDNIDPLIYYEAPSTRYNGYASFYNCTVSGGNNSNGMLYKVKNAPAGSLQFINCTLPQALVNNSSNTGNAVWIN